jgi:outer membrane protein OmpU
MNNIKKIGLTALAGSLVMVSANAIEYTVSGGLLTTFTTATQDSGNTVSGRGLGTATDLSFNASGELDNGFTVDYFMSVDTDKILSNTSSFMTVGMGSLGTIRINNDAGSQANAIDDITPHAYNETWDGLTSVTNPSFFGNATTEGSVDYRIAPQEFQGVTVNASYTYDPDANSAAPAKAGVTNTVANGGSGQAVTLQLAHESGLSFGGGYEELDSNAGTLHNNETRATGFVKFASGGFTIAHQEAYKNTFNEATTIGGVNEGADAEATFTGAAYTMGDITVSYAESEYDVKATSGIAALLTEEMTSVQIAYTMGAMTVSAAMSETDNVAGISAINYAENTLAVSFAF